MYVYVPKKRRGALTRCFSREVMRGISCGGGRTSLVLRVGRNESARYRDDGLVARLPAPSNAFLMRFVLMMRSSPESLGEPGDM